MKLDCLFNVATLSISVAHRLSISVEIVYQCSYTVYKTVYQCSYTSNSVPRLSTSVATLSIDVPRLSVSVARLSINVATLSIVFLYCLLV